MKKNHYILLLALAVIAILAFKNPRIVKNETSNDGLLVATLYMQHAAEYQAACYQSFNLGKYKLHEKMAQYNGNKKLAVVVDIDETVLDNSPFSARSILENTDYPKYWDDWCMLAKAKSIPGAMEFLVYAQLKGVETFYISNRKIKLFSATQTNLRNNGFPFADSTHILLRTSSNDKESRRNKVRETHEVVLYFGDNLGDFMSDFDEQPNEKRNALARDIQNDFGDEFIVLPNPTYGTWLNALIEGATPETNTDSIYKARLINF
jgi:5'-nucleotidase (lipoprotein e(P4) family)